jgi:hypothetical protein
MMLLSNECVVRLVGFCNVIYLSVVNGETSFL